MSKNYLNHLKVRKFRRNKGFIFTEISGRQHCFIITYLFFVCEFNIFFQNK